MPPDESAELQHRLHVLESARSRDPAHADLPTPDLVLVSLAVLGLSVWLLWWGMP
ncbi:hypothetical protein [Nocardiopsis salina]|uniref:hypothetical protein n=1 Tax=Nocardiopsis salina TaxID=245836 RepID=UPI00034BBFF2|nr:hypothetical protein [Nocardiopsis salina]